LTTLLPLHHYEHIISSGDLLKRGILGRPGLTSKNPFFSKPKSSRAIRWWLASYMGAAVAKEVVTLWYSTRHFVFGTGSLHLLPQFLREDLFGIGVHPGELVQYLRYHVDAVDGRDCRPKFAGKAFGHLNRTLNKDVDLAICVDNHEKTEKRARVVAEVTAFGALGPIVWRLREQGFGAVSVRRRNPWEDVTGLFEGEEWHGRLVSFGLKEWEGKRC
jgi:hypothetical protein